MLKLDPLKMLIYTSKDFQNKIYLYSQFPNVLLLKTIKVKGDPDTFIRQYFNQ